MPSLLRNNAYQTIRQRLLKRELEPGTRVSELALAKEMGISRAPVREAINRLASEGLVMQIPNAGTFVKRPNRIDLENLYQVRLWLECEAAAETAHHASQRRLKQMQDALDQMQAVAREHQGTGRRFLSEELFDRHLAGDLAFHLALIRGCGNRMVSKLVDHHHLMSQIWCAVPEEDIARVYSEHLRIFHAVRDGDGEAARQLMREHLTVACHNALDRYDWHQRQQAAEGTEEIAWPETLREGVVQMEEGTDDAEPMTHTHPPEYHDSVPGNSV